MAKPNCSIDGCESPAIAKELCWKHYQRRRRTGTTNRRVRLDDLRELISRDTECCIEWPYSRQPYGYGRVWTGEGFEPTHRVSLREAGIKPAEGENVVRHLCNNPPCVNPKHLAWGTAQDNMDDRSAHGVFLAAMAVRDPRTLTNRANSTNRTCTKCGNMFNRQANATGPASCWCLACRREYNRLRMKRVRSAS